MSRAWDSCGPFPLVGYNAAMAVGWAMAETGM